MIDPTLFQEITATYQKFGWTLERIFLTTGTQEILAEVLNSIDKNILIENSDLNALCFSRVAGNRETWELRLLDAAPFALIETCSSSASRSERAETLQKLLEKLRASRLKFKV